MRVVSRCCRRRRRGGVGIVGTTAAIVALHLVIVAGLAGQAVVTDLELAVLLRLIGEEHTHQGLVVRAQAVGQPQNVVLAHHPHRGRRQVEEATQHIDLVVIQAPGEQVVQALIVRPTKIRPAVVDLGGRLGRDGGDTLQARDREHDPAGQSAECE